MPIPYPETLTVLVAVMGYVTAIWLLSLRLRNSGIMDIFWGPGFLLAAGVAWVLAPGSGARATLTLGLVAVWAVRLAWHIGKRNFGAPEDARYARWRHEGGRAWWWRSWFKVFLLQGLILWFVSLPLQTLVSAENPHVLTAWDLAGAAIFLVGLAFESVADAQLAAFKSDPDRSGVLDTGLWRYSRHPNYFGESVVWCGVGIMVCGVPGGWVLLASPGLMIWLIVRVSGVRMLDALLAESKEGYADYMSRTSGFLPRRPGNPG